MSDSELIMQIYVYESNKSISLLTLITITQKLISDITEG